MNLQSVKQRYGIIGNDPGLDRVLSTALRVASTDLTVLIMGESGVGKEAISRIIHDYSSRKHEGFIAINCGAIPPGTINSELFGHEKGAFTGATSDRKGYFETFDGGTIFLDEIGEMPLDTQSYLLRVLESGEFIRVGASKTQRTDVRIVAATNVELLQQVKDNKFREDLYYRLNTVPIHMPPLRERREDIHLLFRKFAADFAERYRSETVRLDKSAQMLLENYNWPGNVRELRNLVEQLSVLTEEGHKTLDASQLATMNPQLLQRILPARTENDKILEMTEREILFKVLLEMKGDLSDLKSLVFDLIQHNDLEAPNMSASHRLLSPTSISSLATFEHEPGHHAHDHPTHTSSESSLPIIIDRQQEEAYDSVEVVEENLSLQDAERTLIAKALKKYNGRRKEASEELGISERTLYRKIKEYEL